MTTERWCQTCGGYQPLQHDHAEQPPSLFDPPVVREGLTPEQGRAERDKAMDAVESHTDFAWKQLALQTVRFLALNHQEFVADDLWGYIEKPSEPRALGPVMRAAQKQGLIEPTERYKPNPNRHSTPTRIWRSLLFEAAS